jgi:hypothetical protein
VAPTLARRRDLGSQTRPRLGSTTISPGMSVAFSGSLLLRLAGSYSIKIETADQPGDPTHHTTIWAVVDERTNAVYVRSIRGAQGNWYRRLLANPDGSIVAGSERIAVRAVPVTANEVALVSDLFRRKYPADQHLFAILRPEVIAATLQLEPS